MTYLPASKRQEMTRLTRPEFLFGLLVAWGLCTGCSAPQPPKAPVHRATAPGYTWPPRTLRASPDSPGATPSQSPVTLPNSSSAKSRGASLLSKRSELARKQSHRVRPRELPSLTGQDCLNELESLDVAFQPLDELRGVQTPVEISGSLGGVTYWSSGGGPLRLDCRLALALCRVGPLLRGHGVTKARFSGAYVYRTTRSGRLSHHAYGLAIDIHEFLVRGSSLSVDSDFSRGVDCQPNIPQLNRISCALKQSRVFDEFLTPDYNRAHHDHLHISIPRRGGS